MRFATLLILLSACLPAQVRTVSFSSSGTWTVPAGVTSLKLECWGGGGHGGRDGDTHNETVVDMEGNPYVAHWSDAPGAGGGGGAYARRNSWTVTPGTVVNFTVAGQNISGLGPGTTITISAGTACSAASGAAGTDGSGPSVAYWAGMDPVFNNDSVNGVAGPGGSSGIGDVIIPGEPGGSGGQHSGGGNAANGNGTGGWVYPNGKDGTGASGGGSSNPGGGAGGGGLVIITYTLPRSPRLIVVNQ